MVRAESLASLHRAATLAARVLGGQAIGARPAAAAVHHALRTACTALSVHMNRPSGPVKYGHRWAPQQQQQPGSWAATRGFSAVHAAAAAPAETGLIVTEKAVQRLQELASTTPGEAMVLRLTVEGGGCSGYTYNFTLESETRSDDRLVEEGGVQLACDPVSYEFVRGATIDYTTDIIRSAFEVVTNPNAEASCGCGSSFAPKD